MDERLTAIENIGTAKLVHRRRRAVSLTFPEKIRILVEMQKRRAPILKMRGKSQRVWEIS